MRPTEARRGYRDHVGVLPFALPRLGQDSGGRAAGRAAARAAGHPGHVVRPLASTVGTADPAHVYEICTRLVDDFPAMTFMLHLRNTRGLGLTNVLAGMAAGVWHFDSSIGGLAGCPFAPGASGNIATEDLVHMLGLLGIETGIDLDAIRTLARDVVTGLVDHPLDSSLGRAELSWVLAEATARQMLPDAGSAADVSDRITAPRKDLR